MRITFWKIFIFLGLVLVSIYFWNPFGTATLDPRARLFGVTLYKISNSSMAPTLEKGDHVLVKTFAYANKPPKLGDIVVFKDTGTNGDFAKRVVARGGDTIAVKDNVAIRNGKILTEDYIQVSTESAFTEVFEEVTVPDNRLFVLGDNRQNSRDSRYLGFISEDKLIGKVFYIWRSNDHDRDGSI